MFEWMLACAKDTLDKMAAIEKIGSKFIVKSDETKLRLTGKVMTRYLDPITLNPTSDWQINHNLVVDTGAVEIVKWLVNSSAIADGAFKYMALGSTGTAAAHGQTALLSEYADSSTPGALYAREVAVLAAVAEGAYGNKVYQATATFAASTQTDRDKVAEFGMFNTLASGTGIMYNRSVLSPVRDNMYNALEIIYQCTVAPV